VCSCMVSVARSFLFLFNVMENIIFLQYSILLPSSCHSQQLSRLNDSAAFKASLMFPINRQESEGLRLFPDSRFGQISQ
jgi:hypothetical protein